MKLKSIVMLMGAVSLNASVYAMSELTELEMSQTEGQALMSLSYIAPTDNKNLMKNITGSNNVGFYKLGLEAEIQLNANIKNLQLGCGGINGAGKCDIDIKNLSLSGLNTSSVTQAEDPTRFGTPKFSEGRAATSAILTNPFFEFAIKNPNSAALREVVGIRTSAESISGLLSAGLDNYSTASKTDGILSLSGFMQIAATNGKVDTAEGMFGKQSDYNMDQFDNPNAQIIAGRVYIPIFGTHGIRSIPNHADTTGIKVASMLNVPFNVPQQVAVNGNRVSSARVENVTTMVAAIPMAKPVGCNGIAAGTATACNTWDNDQLMVGVTPENNPKYGAQTCVRLVVCILDEAKFKMGEGSQVKNLNMEIAFNQSLSMFHNIALSGTGGYLSLQSIPLIWPGAVVASSDASKNNLSQFTKGTDVAQSGWWMSFDQPVQLGELRPTQKVDISSALPQVAKLATQKLLDDPAIEVGLLSAVGALINIPITQTLDNIDVGSYTQANPAKITLNDLQLTGQYVVPNCWGNLKFC